MRALKLWEKYTREEVHDIFDPESDFTTGSGRWGLPGIVRIPDSYGDFVFFVTFGSRQGDHAFQEEITEDGVLTWQAQPKQRLEHVMIKQLIDHNDLTNTIHLFLRTRAGIPYTYLGELGYLDHDPTRESPVYFTWQLKNWPADDAVLQDLGVTPARTEQPTSPPVPRKGQLIKTDPPIVKPSGTASSGGLNRAATLPRQDDKNRKLGLAGEAMVLKHELERLREAGRGELADKVAHVSVDEGDAAGYDIRSYTLDGTPRYIEVKTTKGPRTSEFFISPNEVKFSEEHPDTYVLVRVYGYSYETDSAYYFEIPGPVTTAFELAPSEYRARLMPR